MIGLLRRLAVRRERLVARSTAQRGALAVAAQPAALRIAAAQSVLGGLGAVLVWMVQLAPLYALLRRR